MTITQKWVQKLPRERIKLSCQKTPLSAKLLLTHRGRRKIYG